jgi:hypothetical protein
MSFQVHLILSFGGFRRPPARSDADRPLCQRLDLLLKAFASPCTLLLGVLAEIVEGFFFHLLVYQGKTKGSPFRRRGQ